MDVQIAASGFTSQVEVASDEEDLEQEFEKVHLDGFTLRIFFVFRNGCTDSTFCQLIPVIFYFHLLNFARNILDDRCKN